MTTSPARLGLLRNVPADGNPFNPERIQTSIGGRPTEDSAFIPDVDPFPDVTHLRCSNCQQWKPDAAFYRDKRSLDTKRRGRDYYCRQCRMDTKNRKSFDKN